jgi:predicted DCC family thiol-disulfide oxidoreductase YuxK
MRLVDQKVGNEDLQIIWATIVALFGVSFHFAKEQALDESVDSTDSVEGAAPVWLYDGACALCLVAARYTLAHEIKPSIRFVAVQSREGREIAANHGIDPDDPESFLFLERGRALAKSDGVLAIARRLRGLARLVLLGRFLPRPVRDWLYDRVARSRYRIFGRREICGAPGAAVRDRFIFPDIE